MKRDFYNIKHWKPSQSQIQRLNNAIAQVEKQLKQFEGKINWTDQENTLWCKLEDLLKRLKDRLIFGYIPKRYKC